MAALSCQNFMRILKMFCTRIRIRLFLRMLMIHIRSPPAACWRNRVLPKVSSGLSRTRLSWEVFRNYRLHHHKNSLFKKAIIGIIIIWDKIHKKWKHVIIIINPVVGSFSLLRWKFPKKNLVSSSDSQAHFQFPGSSATRHETWWGTWEALAL